MKTIWSPFIWIARSWRKILPHRLLVRAFVMLVGLSGNVQAQQLQIEQMYARLRYNQQFLREYEGEERDPFYKEQLI